MAYVLPQVLVFQEFTQVPTAITEPLRAHIAGPNAELFRYAIADEKNKILLGDYNYAIDTTYNYPSRPAGGIVDQNYVKLYGDDLLLTYHEDAASGSYGTCIPRSDYKNRITSSAVNYKANTVTKSGVTTTYARHSSLNDRDVTPGDIVDVTGVASTGTLTVRTTVADIVGTSVAASYSAATADANNVGSKTLGTIVTKIGGADNCVSVSADGSTYDGSEAGYVVETYTITVTKSSTSADHTGARLSVKSASGTDDIGNVIPSAIGVATTIGTRGLTVTFSESDSGSCSVSAAAAGVGLDDLTVGQVWTVEVTQDWTPASFEAGDGGYGTGPYDTTYIITVTKGGKFSSSYTENPQVTISTTTGVDSQGANTMPGPFGSQQSIGSYNALVKLGMTSGSGLVTGDVYYLTVVAAYEGNMRTLVLGDNIPQKLIDESVDCTVKLHIKKTGVEIPLRRASAPGSYNYDLGTAGVLDTNFVIKSGITLYDPTWTSSSVEQPITVTEGKLYLQYRAYLPTKSTGVFEVSGSSGLSDIPGQLHPDNPLKWAVSKALENSNGTAVKYTAVADPSTTDSWIAVLDQLYGRTDVYGLVPLTRDAAVISAWSAHVASQSSAETGRWRALWVNLSATPTTVVVDSTTTSDSSTALAVVGLAPDSATDYTYVTVPAANGNFVTNGVRSGDIMRYNYTPDGWGTDTYTEFVIDQVVSENTLLLKTGQGSVEVTTAKKVEIWRNLTNAELATQIAGVAGGYGSRRIRALWPDTVGSGGTTFEGYHLCAALAGLRSGVVPQQSLTNIAITGFDDLSRTEDLFNQPQLNTMANSGVWVVHKPSEVATRHAITTAGYGDVTTQEESVTSNVDSMAYLFLSRTSDLIGKANVTPGTIDIVQNRLEATITFFKEVRVSRLGGQLTDASILEVRQHTVLKDRIVSNLQLTVPVPLNNLEVNLQIVA